MAELSTVSQSNLYVLYTMCLNPSTITFLLINLSQLCIVPCADLNKSSNVTRLETLYKTNINDLEWSTQAVCTLQWHQYCSRSHHTQCPTHCSYRCPLCLHLECYLQPISLDQLSMELQINDNSLLTFSAAIFRCYLHTLHQHQQSEDSYDLRLVC